MAEYIVRNGDNEMLSGRGNWGNERRGSRNGSTGVRSRSEGWSSHHDHDAVRRGWKTRAEYSGEQASSIRMMR